MKKIIIACIFSFCSLWGYSQQLTLEECCDIAAANNKQGKLADFSMQKAQLQLKNMNSNFLPKLSAAGGYLYADKNFGAELMPSVAAELKRVCQNAYPLFFYDKAPTFPSRGFVIT